MTIVSNGHGRETHHTRLDMQLGAIEEPVEERLIGFGKSRFKGPSDGVRTP